MAQKLSHDNRFPFLENDRENPHHPQVETIAPYLNDPRCFKSHLHPKYFHLALDAGAKFVVTTRNVKDTVVSNYHFRKEVFKVNPSIGFIECEMFQILNAAENLGSFQV